MHGSSVRPGVSPGGSRCRAQSGGVSLPGRRSWRGRRKASLVRRLSSGSSGSVPSGGGLDTTGWRRPSGRCHLDVGCGVLRDVRPAGGGRSSDWSPPVDRIAKCAQAGLVPDSGRRFGAEDESREMGRCLSGAAVFGPLQSSEPPKIRFCRSGGGDGPTAKTPAAFVYRARLRAATRRRGCAPPGHRAVRQLICTRRLVLYGRSPSKSTKFCRSVRKGP